MKREYDIFRKKSGRAILSKSLSRARKVRKWHFCSSSPIEKWLLGTRWDLGKRILLASGWECAMVPSEFGIPIPSKSRNLSLPIPNPNPKSRIFRTPSQIPIPNPEFSKLNPNPKSRIFQKSIPIPIPDPEFFKINPNPNPKSWISGLGSGFGRDRWDFNPKCRPLGTIRFKSILHVFLHLRILSAICDANAFL